MLLGLPSSLRTVFHRVSYEAVHAFLFCVIYQPRVRLLFPVIEYKCYLLILGII